MEKIQVKIPRPASPHTHTKARVLAAANQKLDWKKMAAGYGSGGDNAPDDPFDIYDIAPIKVDADDDDDDFESNITFKNYGAVPVEQVAPAAIVSDNIPLLPDISALTPETVITFHKLLVSKWIIPPEEMLTDLERCIRLTSNLKLDINDLQQEELKNAHEDEMVFIQSQLVGVEKFADVMESGLGESIRKDLHKILNLCQTTFESLESIVRLREVMMSTSERNSGRGHLLTDQSENRLSPKQEFICFLYRKAARYSFRKFQNMLFEPICTPSGQSTHAYRQSMSIVDFVQNNCDRHLSDERWSFVTSERRGTTSTLADIADTIKTIKDYELPDVIRDRHKFSFKNGIFLTRLEHGQPLTTTPSKGPNRGRRFYSRFIPYDHPDFGLISEREISAKYFDTEFVDYPDDGNWYDIPTPTLQYILRYQYSHRDDCEEICQQLYRDIGRALFNRGDLENWQYACYLIGQAGSGKSTIIDQLLKKVYEEATNIAEIDNKIEAQFGLGALLKKGQIFLTTAGELDSNCQLDTASLLRMISGEEVMGAVKNGDPITTQWPSHLLLAGNKFPEAWKDTGDNIGRRFLMYYFDVKVRKADIISDLNEKLKLELPTIILKCVRAYHDVVNKYAPQAKGIWYFCPKYFLETRNKLKKDTNMLHGFMTDTANIVISPTLMVSEADVIREYKEYAKARGQPHMLRGKEMAFQSIVQELSDEYDGSVIQYRIVPEQLYHDEMHYGAAFFFGLGLTSKLTDAQKHQLFSVENKNIADASEEEEQSYDGDNDKGKEDIN